MSAIDYILTILILASLYLNWHLVQVCRSAMKARKKALRDAQRLLKRGEEAQEQAIADKRRFLEALGEAFLLIGPSGHIVLANTLAKELFQEEKLEGRKVGALVCNQELLGHVQEAFDTDGPVTKEFTLSAANSPGGVQNGITAWHLDSAITDAPIREKRILLRNITQNYLTNQMRRDFVANASHELRTPLTIIVGYLENLMEDDLVEESPGLARKFIGVMHQNSQRLMNIIEDMLMISKLESGHKAILKEQWFRLTSCADDVFSRLDSIREKKQAVLHMDIPTDWELYGDPPKRASPFLWKPPLARSPAAESCSAGHCSIWWKTPSSKTRSRDFPLLWPPPKHRTPASSPSRIRAWAFLRKASPSSSTAFTGWKPTTPRKSRERAWASPL